MSTRAAASLLVLVAAGSPSLSLGLPEQGLSDAASRPSHSTAAGTLANYDAVARVLTMHNATGFLEFHVASDARCWLGNRRVPVARLETHAGAQVTVAWSEASGVRTTHTVRVSDSPPRGAAEARSAPAPPSRSEAFPLRGVPQALHIYGAPGGKVAIVTSGDGGWVHLGPDVATFLADEGYRVVGFDAKAYLSSFTSRSGPLHVEDVPSDYAALIEHASSGAPGRVLLVGVSEGAGLSVLAASAPATKTQVAGVVALGLPDRNELGWRWRDSIVYITKGTPDEPTFSAREIASRVSPVPLALLHSTHDEFVGLPEVRVILAQAREPKKLWAIEASDHRFSDNRPELRRRLKEAITWIESQGSAVP